MSATKEIAQANAIAAQARQFEWQGKQYNSLTGKLVSPSKQKFLAISDEFHAYVTAEETGLTKKHDFSIKIFGDAVMELLEDEKTLEKLVEIGKRLKDEKEPTTRNRKTAEQIKAEALEEFQKEQSAKMEAIKQTLIDSKVAAYMTTAGTTNKPKATSTIYRQIVAEVEKMLA